MIAMTNLRTLCMDVVCDLLPKANEQGKRLAVGQSA